MKNDDEKDTNSEYVRVACNICFGQGQIDKGFNDYIPCPAKCDAGFIKIKNKDFTRSSVNNLSNQ